MVYSWQRLRLQQDSSCDRWSWLFLQEWTACHWLAARQLGVEEKMGWMVIPHKDNFSYTEINIKYMIWRHSIFIIKLRGLEPHLRAWSAQCLQSGTSTPRPNGPLKQRKGSTSKALCQPSLSKSAASLDLWKKNMMQKHTKKTHTNTSKYNIWSTCYMLINIWNTHQKKNAKPKPSFLQLSSPSCCLLWQRVIARTDGITWPQGVLPSTIHSTLQSCSVLLFLLHVASKPSSTIFSVLSVCVLSLSRCFLQLPILVPPLIQISPRPQQAEPSECTYQEASSATGILLNPTAMNSPSIAHFGARPSKHHPSDLSSAQNLSLVGL